MGIPSGMDALLGELYCLPDKQSQNQPSDLPQNLASRLRHALDSIKSKGQPCCSGTTQFIDPQIYITEANYVVQLPLQVNDAMTISQTCRQPYIPTDPYDQVKAAIRHGYCNEYRKCGMTRELKGMDDLPTRPKFAIGWTLQPEQFQILNPEWNAFVQNVLSVVNVDLGCAGSMLGQPKLKLFGPGAWTPNAPQTTQHAGAVGTLAINLPSAHHGGQIRVSHQGQQWLNNTQNGAQSYFACYAGVHAEMDVITCGYSLSIEYELFNSPSLDMSSSISPDISRSILEPVQQWEKSPGSINEGVEAIYLLDHRYSDKGLSISSLKDRDYLVASALHQACVGRSLCVFLASISNSICSSGDTTAFFYKQILELDGTIVAKEVGIRQEGDILQGDRYAKRTMGDADAEESEDDAEGTVCTYENTVCPAPTDFLDNTNTISVPHDHRWNPWSSDPLPRQEVLNHFVRKAQAQPNDRDSVEDLSSIYAEMIKRNEPWSRVSLEASGLQGGVLDDFYINALSMSISDAGVSRASEALVRRGWVNVGEQIRKAVDRFDGFRTRIELLRALCDARPCINYEWQSKFADAKHEGFLEYIESTIVTLIESTHLDSGDHVIGLIKLIEWHEIGRRAMHKLPALLARLKSQALTIAALQSLLMLLKQNDEIKSFTLDFCRSAIPAIAADFNTTALSIVEPSLDDSPAWGRDGLSRITCDEAVHEKAAVQNASRAVGKFLVQVLTFEEMEEHRVYSMDILGKLCNPGIDWSPSDFELVGTPLAQAMLESRDDMSTFDDVKASLSSFLCCTKKAFIGDEPASTHTWVQRIPGFFSCYRSNDACKQLKPWLGQDSGDITLQILRRDWDHVHQHLAEYAIKSVAVEYSGNATICVCTKTIMLLSKEMQTREERKKRTKELLTKVDPKGVLIALEDRQDLVPCAKERQIERVAVLEAGRYALGNSTHFPETAAYLRQKHREEELERERQRVEREKARVEGIRKERIRLEEKRQSMKALSASFGKSFKKNNSTLRESSGNAHGASGATTTGSKRKLDVVDLTDE